MELWSSSLNKTISDTSEEAGSIGIKKKKDVVWQRAATERRKTKGAGLLNQFEMCL